MLKNSKKNILLLFSIFLVCLLAAGCNNNSQKIENEPFPTTTEFITTTSYSYASHLNLDEKALENLLTIKKDDKEYKLIPATKSETDLEYWKSLVTKDKEYMQTFFLNREPLTNSKAILQFNDTMEIMWGIQKPNALLFMVLLNGNYAGILRCVGLTNEETVTVGFITAKEYAGQGIATQALGMFIKLVKHLKETEFYNIPTASLWIFDDNLASISVATKNGFICTKLDTENKRSRYDLKL